MKKYNYVKEITGDLFPSRTENIFAAQSIANTSNCKMSWICRATFYCKWGYKDSEGIPIYPPQSIIWETGNTWSLSSIGGDPLSSLLEGGIEGILPLAISIICLRSLLTCIPASLHARSLHAHAVGSPRVLNPGLSRRGPVPEVLVLGTLSPSHTSLLDCSNGCASSTARLEMPLGNSIPTLPPKEGHQWVSTASQHLGSRNLVTEFSREAKAPGKLKRSKWQISICFTAKMNELFRPHDAVSSTSW